MTRQQRLFMLLGAIAISPFVIVACLWLWLLFSRDPFNHPLSRTGSWPIACSLRSCLTTSSWHKQYEARTLFAKTINQDMPSPNDALTTLIRQRLVNESFVHSPVTIRDAVRYREEILQARDETKVLSSTGLSTNDYDKLVILPLLQQEMLREERDTADLGALFKQLAAERMIWIFPATLKWDKSEAKVITSSP